VTGLRTAELWGLPAPRTGSYALAVISDDETLAERAMEALDREGLEVRLLATGADTDVLEDLDRRATLVILRCPRDRRSLDRSLRHAERWAAGAIVVVVVGHADHVDLGLTLGNGADALVRDDDLHEALGPAVRAAASGQFSAPAALLRFTRPAALSIRERQVLALALEGLSNGEIAERLYLAPSTVKSHISAAFRRLGVHSRREAMALIFASDDALQRSVRATLGVADKERP
jgi:DNA-binding NarL/FixJ family response regulator